MSSEYLKRHRTEAEQAFHQDTADHRLRILRDDGLYRHLRCSRPDSWFDGFNVVTWPGYLVIGGDRESYVFACEDDMFAFLERCFSQGSIDFNYWASKLLGPGGSRTARRYSAPLFVQKVRHWRDSVAESMDGAAERAQFRAAVDEDILGGEYEDETQALMLLRDFSFGDGVPDYHEWTITEFDFHFIWACCAIRWAIGKYRAATAEPEARVA